MGKIKYDLLPKQKSHKHNLKVEIDLYSYATELYEELARIGIIERIKEIPQLGVIKVSKKLSKTRYDYIMLQLYLHRLIKDNLQGQLRLTYNNRVNSKEFREDYKFNLNSDEPSIGDVIQLLTIIYNIGHFYNTFTASRAVTMIASEDENFLNMVLAASDSDRYKAAANTMIREGNYQRFHLLNSILILEHCDRSKKSVSLGLEILYSYINESMLPDNHKLKYIYSLFRNVRTVSYIAYDLQIANTPLTIDVCNEKAMLLIFQELLSEYNNNQPLNRLVTSLTKLLDDTVYNENSNAICYYKISHRMASLLKKESNYSDMDYYKDLFLTKDSILNRSYSHKRDYAQVQILKLTFKKEDRWLSKALLCHLECINNTRVGYYDRHSGEQTVLVSIKSNCSSASKTIAAFKTMKCSIQFLRKINGISNADLRFLLCVKFFLFYLFNENPVVIKPTINREKCVICTRGKKIRIKEIQALLKNSVGNEDENHEIKFMLNQLTEDIGNDTTITIPASILVYQKRAVGCKLCEFDGIIIHPMRNKEQVIFLEAKNTSKKPTYGKKCLKEKLNKLSFGYSTDDIRVIDHNAVWKYSI